MGGVQVSDEPVQVNDQSEKTSNRPEYLKFVGLLAILLITVGGLALFSPIIFDNVVPAIMGLDGAPGTGGIPPSDPVESPAEVEGAPENADPGSITETGQELHVVQEGESLDEIATKYGVSVESIAAANHLVSRQLHQGTELIIPSAE